MAVIQVKDKEDGMGVDEAERGALTVEYTLSKERMLEWRQRKR